MLNELFFTTVNSHRKILCYSLRDTSTILINIIIVYYIYTIYYVQWPTSRETKKKKPIILVMCTHSSLT